MKRLAVARQIAVLGAGRARLLKKIRAFKGLWMPESTIFSLLLILGTG
jgi:hypothetical protein